MYNSITLKTSYINQSCVDVLYVNLAYFMGLLNSLEEMTIMFFYKSLQNQQINRQWIGLGGNLQENPISNCKNHGFL